MDILRIEKGSQCGPNQSQLEATEQAMSERVKPVPEGYHTVAPYLVVENSDQALSFIQRAFDGRVRYRQTGPDDTVRHAEIQIGDSIVMIGQRASDGRETRAKIHLYVPDVDETYRRVIEAGGRPLREPQNMFYGNRSGVVEDAWGTQWWISTRIEDVSAEEASRRATDQDREFEDR